MGVREEKPSAFKHWINASVIEDYSRGLKTATEDFEAKEFLNLRSKLKKLELRERVQLIAHAFRKHLAKDYSDALDELLSAVESENITGFALWPVTEFIQLYGLNDFKKSFEAMKIITTKFTAEFAVRPFIRLYPEKSFTELCHAATSANVHHRRWASEGSRPRLPWGERLHNLILDPRENIKILELLKFDSELYVRKSVSNHLNDISKDHPDLVIRTLRRWLKEAPSEVEKKNLNFILHRSLRSLIKEGHADALKLIGFNPSSKELTVRNLQLGAKRVRMGGSLEFEFSLKNLGTKEQKYLVDYRIYYKKANGKLSPKVFKLRKGLIAPSTTLKIKKKHSLRKITTRTYYAGTHSLELLLNGKTFLNTNFELTI